MIIAIDGPSGAGKSTITHEAARQLGFSCLDTGAMYRSVAWRALENGVALDDASALERIAREYPIRFVHEAGNPAPKQVFIGTAEVTDAIRTARIDRSVSAVSAVPGVRAALVDQQRVIGQGGNYVVEGRDIGTVVFPDAQVKVFLTASVEERARRRVQQNEQRGVGSCVYEEVLADLQRRDDYDSSRAASPLKPAEDAVLLDSTALSFEEVLDCICRMAREAQERA